MAAILGKAWQGYQILFQEIVDPRTKDWLFVAKPYQVLAVLALYLGFVFKWGPSWMKNRQPFNLDKILIVYNAFQVLACCYVFIQGLYKAWGWDYKWICEPVDFSRSQRALDIAQIVYFYYLLKIIDLLDTIFFVFRKKFNQVSFLHVYHHTGMVLLTWGAITYLPGGHGTLVGFINSFVHMVMYTYYLLTVAVPSIKDQIWIKKHVTQLQILQFFWCVVHMVTIVFKTDCGYPRWTSAVFLPQNVFMLVLFTDFYIKTYIKKPKEKIIAQNNNSKQNNANNHKNGVVTNKIGNVNNFNNVKDIKDAQNCIKKDLSKTVNSYNNNYNEFCEKFNACKRKENSNCTSGKCKMDGSKEYKYE